MNKRDSWYRRDLGARGGCLVAIVMVGLLLGALAGVNALFKGPPEAVVQFGSGGEICHAGALPLDRDTGAILQCTGSTPNGGLSESQAKQVETFGEKLANS